MRSSQIQNLLPGAMLAVSFLLIAGSLGYMVLVPAPRAYPPFNAQIAAQASQAKAQALQAQQAIAPRAWRADARTVSAGVLGLLSVRTNNASVNLDAFRPQKNVPLGGVTELQYSVQVSGAYPAIRAVLASLDAPGSKVALRSVQIVSSQQTSNEVTVNLGLSAYMENAHA